MNVTHTSRFDAPPEAVIEAYCSEDYQLSIETVREGVAETGYVTVEHSDDRRVFELRSREYKRTMTGALDRSGTVPSTTRNTYDAKTGTIRWVYTSGNTDRLTLSGTYRFEPDGGGTKMIHDATIEVRVPMVGGRIAKYIAGEMKKSFADQDRRLTEALA